MLLMLNYVKFDILSQERGKKNKRKQTVSKSGMQAVRCKPCLHALVGQTMSTINISYVYLLVRWPDKRM
jgi:hypothetical protein